MKSQVDNTPRIEQLRSVAVGVLQEESSGQIELPENREVIFVSPEDLLGLIHNIEGAAKAMHTALGAFPKIDKEAKDMTNQEKNQVYVREVLMQELNILDDLFGQHIFDVKPKVSYDSRGIFPTKDVTSS